MRAGIGLALLFWAGAGSAPQGTRAADPHSYARPEHVRVRHVHLDLEVDFDRQRLRGQATLTVERTSKDDRQPKAAQCAPSGLACVGLHRLPSCWSQWRPCSRAARTATFRSKPWCGIAWRSTPSWRTT